VDSGLKALDVPRLVRASDSIGLGGTVDPVESLLILLHKAVRPIACRYKEGNQTKNEFLGKDESLEIYHQVVSLLDRHYPKARPSEQSHPLGWVRKEQQLFGRG